MLIHLIDINYILFNSLYFQNSFWNPPNNLRTLTELFRLSLVNTLIIPNIPKPSLNIIDPLSVFPYGSGILQTSSRHLSGE
jgi:hypothetical protein